MKPTDTFAACLALIDNCQWQEASDLLAMAPASIQASSQGCEMRAFLAKKTGDLPLAENALRQLIVLNPKANHYALLASNLYQQQRFTEARANWQQVIELQPHSLQAHYHVATSYLACGDYLAALPWLERCLELQTDDVAVLFQCATVHCHLEQQTQAKAYFDRVLRLDPYHVEALNNYGVCCLQEKDYPKAIHCFATAMRVDETHTPSLGNLAQTLLKADRFQEAAVYFEQYIAKAPEDLNACYNAGVVALMLAQLNQAEQYFLKIIAKTPDNIASLLNLAAIALQKKEPSNAIGYYQRVLAMQPHHPIATYTLAALLGQNLPDKAPDEYIAALFDRYATHFDRHLCDTLSYQTPKHLRALYDRLLFSGPVAHLLDLGCGTGLSGAAFTTVASHLTGVDLSQQMLDVASAKDIYQVLIHSEIVAFLAGSKQVFEVIIAADVLGYIGDLRDFMNACAQRLSVGGWLLLSIEQPSVSDNKAYVLSTHGRFQHALTYIDTLAKAYAFKLSQKKTVTLRQQEGMPVLGQVLALQKQ
jgi:predicted TPR repeat methyltransferase